MSISNFVPTIWSETLCNNLDRYYVGIANCTRDFEGEIKEKGSKVVICKLEELCIGDYERGLAIGDPEFLEGYTIELDIEKARYFNFEIDDIDKAQLSPKVMDAAMKLAASGLAREADRYIYEQQEDALQVIESPKVTPDNILDTILRARTKLYENNVGPETEVVLEVSPSIAEIMFKAKLNLSTDNDELLQTGCIGSIAGFKVFVTNNLVREIDSNRNIRYHCFARTKRAIAFAEQISEIEAYRPDGRFADAVKGLHLYGAKIIYPEELIRLDLSVGDNPVNED